MYLSKRKLLSCRVIWLGVIWPVGSAMCGGWSCCFWWVGGWVLCVGFGGGCDLKEFGWG